MGSHTIAVCRAAFLAAGLLGFTIAGTTAVNAADADQSQPQSAQPTAPAPGSSGGSGTLSKELNRTGGVLKPPKDVDPGMTKPAPALGGHSTPVIPPPGTPGGNPEVNPK